MAHFALSHPPVLWRKYCRSFLAFLWAAGLLIGMLVSLPAGDFLIPLMRSAPYVAVSFVSLLCVTVLPFLFTAAAVFLSRSWLIMIVCFAKAFILGYVSGGIFQAYGTAGWLMCQLLLFGDCVSAPLLYFLWIRYLPGERALNGWEMAALFSLLLLIGSVNYCIISPFLARLIEI